MVRVDHQNDTAELALDNRRAPLVFLVSGRPGDDAEIIGRTVIMSPEDATALAVALSALGEAALVARADAQEARDG